VSERKRLADLKPNPRNPRKITDQKKDMLRKSLDEFGDLSCFLFNVRSGQMEGGHQRTKVLPPDSDIIITQRYDIPTRSGTVAEGYVLIAGEKFKYREVDWDEDKAKAANIAANKHSGEWDYRVYAEVMLELDQVNYDLELTGNTGTEVEHLLTYISGEDPYDITEVKGVDVGPPTDPGEQVNRITIFLEHDTYEDVMNKAVELIKILGVLGVTDMSSLFIKLVNDAYAKEDLK
jgi:hypothetical protein